MPIAVVHAQKRGSMPIAHSLGTGLHAACASSSKIVLKFKTSCDAAGDRIVFLA